MEQKEVLEDLVGACAIMNKFKVKLTEGKDPLRKNLAIWSGRRFWRILMVLVQL